MSTLSTFLGALALLIAQQQAACAEADFQVDPTHTFVNWEVRHFGTSTSRGRFAVSSGSVHVDWDAHTARTEIHVDVGHPDSGVSALDEALKGPDYFATDEFPEALFLSDEFRFEGNKVVAVAGNLTIRGTTLPVTLSATGFNCYFSLLFFRRVCGGDFETTIQRSAFGVRGALPFVSDSVRLLIQIEAPSGAMPAVETEPVREDNSSAPATNVRHSEPPGQAE